ncbi:MAG: MBL fold metallo-hydrolase [Candidatus Neomarinimicrobiota bacterium]
MLIEQIITRQYAENVWLIGDPSTRQGLIIDPGDQASEIISKITELQLQPLAILNTHGHPDHLAAAAELQNHFGIPFYIHANEATTYATAIPFGQMLGINIIHLPEKVIYIQNEEALAFGLFKVAVITTPGHTPGSVCYLIDGRLFAGDTLFRNSVGRVDFPGGSWSQMESSLHKLKILPPETEVYPGHGSNTTIAHELRHNPYMRKNI